MESRAKVLGHPVHPMLVVFPLGLLVTATVLDVVARYTRRKDLAVTAYWNIAGGLLGGMVAAVFGLIDWLAIPSGTRAKRIGLFHALGNLVVTGLFGASWWLRRDDPTEIPDTLSLNLELAATMVGSVSGWLGGELVDRLGVGVDEGAHLNSPNALSGRPASENSEDGDGGTAAMGSGQGSAPAQSPLEPVTAGR